MMAIEVDSISPRDLSVHMFSESRQSTVQENVPKLDSLLAPNNNAAEEARHLDDSLNRDGWSVSWHPCKLFPGTFCEREGRRE